MRVVWAQALMLRTFARNTGFVLAVHTMANLSLDVFWANKPGTICIGAVGWIGGRKLFNFEVEILYEVLWKHGTTNIERNGKLTASWWKQRGVDQGAPEKISKTLATVRMRFRLACEGNSILTWYDFHAYDAFGQSRGIQYIGR